MCRLKTLIGIGCVALAFSSSSCDVEANAVDFNDAYRRASTHLLAGRYDEAVKTIDAVEGTVKANASREPGNVVRVLQIKARAYALQMDLKGLEQFLTQFEKEYEGTSVANSVWRVAWQERSNYFRLTEDLPQLARTLEKERELSILRDRTARESTADDADSLERDCYVHVGTTLRIGDAYRLMGKMDLALKSL